MQRYGYSVVTFLIGFVVGPLFELSLRQALIITNHDLARVLDHPIALGFLGAAAVAAVLFVIPGKRGLKPSPEVRASPR
jgi:putative tricarboxylic transport membrane protein